MQASAFQIEYYDDRDPDAGMGTVRTTSFVTAGAVTIDQVPALFAERTTPHYKTVRCFHLPLERVDTLERSIALDAFAKTLGIAILDREDRNTVRSVLESRYDLEVTDEMIAAALEGVRAKSSSIPLVTEFESGADAVAEAMMQGLREAGLIHEDEAVA